MGYSISTKFKSEKAKNEMFDFLESQRELIKNILATDCEHDCVHDGERLSYAPKLKEDTLLGFDVSLVYDVRSPTYSQWAICVWMAVKAGDKINGKSYIYYDRDERFINFDVSLGDNLETDSMGVLTQLIAILPNGKNPDSYYPEKSNTIILMRELANRYEIVMSQKILDKEIARKDASNKDYVDNRIKI